MNKKIIHLLLIINCNLLFSQNPLKDINFESDLNGFYGWEGYIGEERTITYSDGSTYSIGIFRSPEVKPDGTDFNWSLVNWGTPKELHKDNNYPNILPNSDIKFATKDVSTSGAENIRFARIYKGMTEHVETVSQNADSIYDNKVHIRLESPNGSKHIVRLGNSSANYFSERLSYTFTVTDSTKYILYHYAPVLVDPTHSGRPFFLVEIENHECSKTFYFAEDTVFNDLKKKDSYYYKDWSANLIDLSSNEFMGKEVTLTFITSDCNAGGHAGYAYFDAMFVNSAIEVKNEKCKGNVLDISCSATGLFSKETWEWDFGDGKSSLEKNPKHKYTQEGEYPKAFPISLKITNSDVKVGCQERIIRDTIIITEKCTPLEPCTPNTLIFKEDFGGNSIFSPVVAPQGFSSANTVSGLEYNPWTNFLLPVRLPAYTTFLLYHYNLLNPFALRTDNYSFVKKGKSRSGVWYEPYDHTYAGNPNLGYMMEVNGSSHPATCYSVALTKNLCPGSQLSFSVWGMSLMKSKNYRNAELKLVIRKPGTTTPVAWKDITIENGKGYWEPFELNYVLREGDENGLVFEIVNNSSSGENFHGNDFALDDIEVRMCTPKVELRGSAWICKRGDLRIEYINNNDFSNPTYKWFKSNSGNINGTWSEINGANGSTLLIENAELTDAGYYRLEITDGSGSCPAKSDPMRISVRDCDICAECVSSFAPVPGEKYVLSAWVKETGHSVEVDGMTLTCDDLMITSYENSIISLSFENSNEVIGAMPEGAIIDGWQRIYTEFTVPAEAVKMHLDLGNTGIGESYFDDIRVFPFNGNMKSYVYDPVTMRLVAELDNENYATFYEYDEEGALIRVKKETEKGIMTIREARQAKQKIEQP